MNNRRSASGRGRYWRPERIVPATRMRPRRPPALADPWTYVCTVLALGGAALAQDAVTALARLLT